MDGTLDDPLGVTAILDRLSGEWPEPLLVRGKTRNLVVILVDGGWGADSALGARSNLGSPRRVTDAVVALASERGDAEAAAGFARNVRGQLARRGKPFAGVRVHVLSVRLPRASRRAPP